MRWASCILKALSQNGGHSRCVKLDRRACNAAQHNMNSGQAAGILSYAPRSLFYPSYSPFEPEPLVRPAPVSS